MPYLDKVLRRLLATTIGKAREEAEEGAADALRRLGVAADAPPLYLRDAERALRRTLRAHARSLGDTWDGKTLGSTTRLMETAAFEHWHRMLFGRFLVERNLLIDPASGATIARDELPDLAAERGLSDEWALVEQIAAPALPAVFKPGDPALALPLAPEYAKRLRDLVARLPEAVFTSDDALGWTYQFWRAAEKDRVNKAGGKIGAAELPAVTQLFTEPYMVQFLLHNTLGAWWGAKVLAADPALAASAADEAALREACALPGVDWTYLRFVREEGGLWRPAAGAFPAWPARAAEITICDPCCGSGHFLTEALVILAALRGREEGLDGASAACAVLRDNLHGLEIDGRCVQIAAFNVALTAWGLAGSPVTLPPPHLAWVGAPPPMGRAEMVALADGDAALGRALGALHDQFVQAPLLGSLMEVGARDLLDTDLRERGVAALALLCEGEPERVEGAVAARGLLSAVSILMVRYTLLSTNVPFLGRGKQGDSLANHIHHHMQDAKQDLATAMLRRMHDMAAPFGAIATVTPQSWLFLTSYMEFRRRVLRSDCLSVLVILGEHGFESAVAAGAFTALSILRRTAPTTGTTFAGIDCSKCIEAVEKAMVLRRGEFRIIDQDSQWRNPDSVITPVQITSGKSLSSYADAVEGLSTGDGDRFVRTITELQWPKQGWSCFAGAPAAEADFSGLTSALKYDNGRGDLALEAGARVQGHAAWGRQGIIVGEMRSLPVGRYVGDIHTKITAAIIPRDGSNLAAVYAFVRSEDYNNRVRELSRKLSVATATLVKVPFDLAHWQAVAAERYPNGLPEPYSDDPTQWLFHGHPAHTEPGTELHVALARLAGYRWPAETDTTMRLAILARERIALAATLPPADADGLLPLHPRGPYHSLSDRMRAYLAIAFGEPLTPAREAALVRAADTKLDRKDAREATLEVWLRDRAFRQHCALFGNRPFLWHVWDGLRDGFGAFVHYHRLTHGLLQALAYTHLGDWIKAARDANDGTKVERATLLQAALGRILEGEAPYDVFVRWKPLHGQPVGWAPDLDDGVRLNIRPFVQAGVLREQPRGITWNKDRGTDVRSAPWYDLGPQYGEAPGGRINNHHLTLAEKRAARAQAAE